jgi:hypothetical protein
MTREQIMQTGGKFFSLTFIKKDGTARKITARINLNTIVLTNVGLC